MGIRLTARQMLFGYVAVMAPLVAVHYALAGTRGWTSVVINVLGILVLLAGAAVNHPARRAPWLLLAAANLAARSGIGSLALPKYPLIVPLLKYPLIIAAFLIFIRCRAAGRDPRKWADALIPAMGLALFAWFLIVRPDASFSSLTGRLVLLSVVHLVGDLLMVVTLARLLAPGTLRGLSAALLTVGTIGRVASDAAYVAYDLIGNASTSPTGTALDVGLVICYFTWGAAALHPSMTELTRPAGPRELTAGTAPASMIVLRITSLVAPVVLFAQAWLYSNAIEGWAAIACGVLYGLMLSRLWDVAASYRRSLVRERTLRLASASLASARSVQDVAAAVRAAAATLGPAAPEQRLALLAVRDGDYLQRIEPGGPLDATSEPIGIWHRLACQPMPRFVSRAEFLAVRDDIENGRRNGAGDGTEDDTGGAPSLPLPVPGGPRRRATRARWSSRSTSRTGRTATRSSACSRSSATSRASRTRPRRWRSWPARRPWPWSAWCSPGRWCASAARRCSARWSTTRPTSSSSSAKTGESGSPPRPRPTSSATSPSRASG